MTSLEVYADLWCPFAYVGLNEAIALRDASGRSEPIIIRAWPLELVNGIGLDPETTYLHAQELREQVAPTLFRAVNLEAFPTTTLPALALVCAAYVNDASLGESMSMELRAMLFEHGVDIGSAAVLSELAGRFGIDRIEASNFNAVRDEWRVGQERGVNGSPHFFCGTDNLFCPFLEIEKDGEGHLHLRENTTRLTEFVTGCLEATP